ncbi:MAG: hypothetical protein ABL962_16445 [Fimbriimonadaceae bacterium]
MSILGPGGMGLFWDCFLACALASYPIYRLLLLTKSRQTIDPHLSESHQIKHGTPTMGGLIFLVAMTVAFVEQLLRGGVPYKDFGVNVLLSKSFAVLALFFGFALIGFVDDYVVPRMTAKRGLGWMQKLIAQIAVASLASASMFRGEPLVIVGLSVFMILFWSNAFNFADGLDALAGSLILGISLGFMLLSTFSSEAAIAAHFATALSAGALVFLAFNAPPAKMFMGDVGSLPIGAFFGMMTVLFLRPQPPFSGFSTLDPEMFRTYIPGPLYLPLFILSLAMIAELVPVPMQVAYYKLTKGKRLFPMTPIHHAFEKKGWPESRIVWIFALFQLLCSLAAYTLALGMKPS